MLEEIWFSLRSVGKERRGGMGKGTHGLPSGPRTTPLGSFFGASSVGVAIAVAGSASAGCTGMPVVLSTTHRKWDRIG